MPRKKPFKYVISDVLSTYNQSLYDEVIALIPVVLKKSATITWSAELTDGKAIIEYNKATAPDACFAHELLHIKYELNGLKMPFCKDQEGVKDVVQFLFNNLCHFKFYQEFYDMGFDPEEFLTESDPQTVQKLVDNDILQLNEIFKKQGKITPLIALLRPYISLRSPHDESTISQKQIEKLKELGDDSFFKNIDEILEEWVSSDSLDSSLTLAKLFKACNKPRIGFCITGEEKDIMIAGNIS